MSQPSPSTTQQLIDRVVREVLQQLPAGRSAPAAPASSAAPAPPASAGYPLAEAVISLDALSAVPSGTDQVLIEATAVITPAARDLAGERGIRWVRRGSATPAVAETWWIADTDRAERGEGLSQQLARRNLQVTATCPDTLLGEAAADRARGIVLSDLPAPFVCEACRTSSVRAASVAELNELAAVEASLHPNVWVFDMRRVSLAKAIVLAERCHRLFAPGASR